MNNTRNPSRHTILSSLSGPIGESVLTVSSYEVDEASYMYSELLQTYWVDSVLVTWPENCTGEYCDEYLQVCDHYSLLCVYIYYK